MRITLNEALAASTINAAAALGKADTHGSLEVGKVGDIIIVDAPRWEFDESLRHIHACTGVSIHKLFFHLFMFLFVCLFLLICFYLFVCLFLFVCFYLFVFICLFYLFICFIYLFVLFICLF